MTIYAFDKADGMSKPTFREAGRLRVAFDTRFSEIFAALEYLPTARAV